MKRRKFLAVLSALFIFISVSGQTNFYFSLRMNNPAISDQFNSGISQTNIPTGIGNYQIYSAYQKQESYTSKFGFSLAAGIQHKISEKVKLSIGLDFMKTNFERQDKIIVAQQSATEVTNVIGQPISSFYSLNEVSLPSSLLTTSGTPNGKVNVYYLNIPFSVNYKLLSKLSFNIGFSASLMLASKQYLVGFEVPTTGLINNTDQSVAVLSRWRNPESGTYNLPRTTSTLDLVEKKITTGSGLNNILFLGNLGLSYNVLRSIWVDFKYNYGFTPIYEQQRQKAGKARYNFLELGLKYDIMLRKKP
jgi:opacity protein-like surface antigen